MAKKKDKIEGINSALLEMADIKVTDETIVPEDAMNYPLGLTKEEVDKNNELQKEERKLKKEKPLEKFSFAFYQYTIRRGDNPAIIIYSRNLPKEHIKPHGKCVMIKDAFVETVVTQEFLGFKVSASYKEKIENYEVSFDSYISCDWMIVAELVVLEDWVLQTKNDIPGILQTKKEELILHLDQMQKDGKIQIKKK
jgi:hypothetical protein